MHHGRKDEFEGVPARRELVAFFDEQPFARAAAVVFEHAVYLLIADNGGFGMAQEHFGKRRRMVGLHVMDDDIVELPAAQNVLHVFEELFGDGMIDGIEERRLLVEKEIGIVGDAARDGIDVLKEGEPPIARADVEKIFQNSNGIVHDILRGAARRKTFFFAYYIPFCPKNQAGSAQNQKSRPRG